MYPGKNAGAGMLLDGETLEPLSCGVSVISKKEYSFSTDTVLLASFSMPKTGEKCADFGSGCGAIPLIWLARSNPGQVYAVEIQSEACGMITRSAGLNAFTGRLKVINGDINNLKGGRDMPCGLDLISCNPPYTENSSGLKSGGKSRMAARHEVLCDFGGIAAAAADFLRWGGRFCCCMRPFRLSGVISSLKENGMEPKCLRFVQYDKNRPPFLFLLQANRGGRPGLKVEPTLFVTSEGGEYSGEMKEMYGTYYGGKNGR